MPPYRPGEVAKILGVSPSTIKNYAMTYTSYLSPGAAVVGQPRYFTSEDVRLLAFIAEQSRHGLPRSEITARLDAGELTAFEWQPPQDAPTEATQATGEATPGQVALILVTRLQSDLDAARERERALTDRLIAAESRAARAEGELSELRAHSQAMTQVSRPRPGFWRRVFGG